MVERNSEVGSVILERDGVRELTAEELELVHGGNPAGALVGAASGGLGYIGSSAVSGDFSWGGLGTSVVVGGLAGGTMGATAFGAYAAPRISYLGGMAVEAVERS
jgi:hypothetical protein